MGHYEDDEIEAHLPRSSGDGDYQIEGAVAAADLSDLRGLYGAPDARDRAVEVIQAHPALAPMFEAADEHEREAMVALTIAAGGLPASEIHVIADLDDHTWHASDDPEQRLIPEQGVVGLNRLMTNGVRVSALTGKGHDPAVAGLERNGVQVGLMSAIYPFLGGAEFEPVTERIETHEGIHPGAWHQVPRVLADASETLAAGGVRGLVVDHNGGDPALLSDIHGHWGALSGSISALGSSAEQLEQATSALADANERVAAETGVPPAELRIDHDSRQFEVIPAGAPGKHGRVAAYAQPFIGDGPHLVIVGGDSRTTDLLAMEQIAEIAGQSPNIRAVGLFTGRYRPDNLPSGVVHLPGGVESNARVTDFLSRLVEHQEDMHMSSTYPVAQIED